MDVLSAGWSQPAPLEYQLALGLGAFTNLAASTSVTSTGNSTVPVTRPAGSPASMAHDARPALPLLLWTSLPAVQIGRAHV